MSNPRQLAAAFLIGAAVAVAGTSFAPASSTLVSSAPTVSSPTVAHAAVAQNSTQRPSLLGQHELDWGSFRIFSASVATPVGFVWSRVENGQQVETWALFRPEDANGWAFPGSNHTSVEITINHDSTNSHASTAAFITWCENQFPASMNVDSDDFEVHEHKVSVL